ncbi:hypothetical protein JXB01_03175 [Candidatus Micrarchaeota archaeon]|nr:hypothetical protein [Candidatus Micrarchaeota archaeon]
MAKLMFKEGKTRRMDKGEVLKRTSFPKREMKIFERTLKMCKSASKRNIQPMIVGGVAFRFYAGSEFTCKTAGILTTDIDIVIKGLPEHLKSKADQRKMTEINERRMGSMGAVPVVNNKLSEMEVYYFPEHSGLGALEDVDIFIGNIGTVKVTKQDFDEARVVNIGNDEDIFVRLPHPGFLIATMINPDAAKETRLRRSVYILASLPDEITEIAGKFVQVLERSYFFENSGERKQMYQKIFNRLHNFAGKARKIVDEFIQNVKKELELEES